MPQKKSIALILASRDFGEADRLVVFLTPEEGRVTGVAKHARKSKRRFMNCLEPFSLVRFIFTAKAHQDLARLDSGELVEAFPQLRRDLAPLAAAACLTETTGEIVGAIDNLPELYEALLNALERLAGGGPSGSLLLSHLIRILALAGFKPRLQNCLACGRRNQGLAWFNPVRGGLLCEACVRHNQEGRLYPVHPGSRKLILAALGLPLAHLARLRFPEMAQQEILNLLQALVRQILGKELKSFAFYRKYHNAGS